MLFRDAIYHSMNDRGVYLPDDYNSDAPPAQVNLKVVSKNIFGSMKSNLSKCNQGYQRIFLVDLIISKWNQGAPVPVDMRLRVLQVNFQYNGYSTSF